MNKFSVLLFLAIVPLFGVNCKPEFLTAEVDYWGVWRTDIKKLSMVTPNTSEAARIHMKYQTGLKARAELGLGYWRSLEFRFGGLLNWRNDKTLVNLKGMSVFTDGYTTLDWRGIEAVNARYTSKFNSYEGTYFCHFTPRRIDYFSFAVNVGVRVIDFQDQMELYDKSDFTVQCKNFPVGGQIGFDFRSNSPCWTLKIDARVGFYGNTIKKHVELRDRGNTVLLTSQTYKITKVAYTTDILPSIMFKLDPLYVTAGYEYLVLYNVAYAPCQIKLGRPFNEISAKKNLVMQCAVVGIGVNY